MASITYHTHTNCALECLEWLWTRVIFYKHTYITTSNIHILKMLANFTFRARAHRCLIIIIFLVESY